MRQLELSAILERYERKVKVGRPSYDPVRILTLIFYCYLEGIQSTRKMERLCKESIPCRMIMGNQKPDHSTFSKFLARNRDLFAGLYQQILEIAVLAGFANLEHVALDGTKVKANASVHKAMSYGRICERLKTVPAKIQTLKAMLTQSQDSSVEKQIATDESRLANMVKGKQILEKRAVENARAEAEKLLKRNAKKEAANKKERGTKRKTVDTSSAKPKPSDQISFTDWDSRIMPKSGGAFIQAYNAQVAVDGKNQIVVALDVVTEANDKRQLEPMLSQVKARLGRIPKVASADNGFCSEEALTSPALAGIDLLISVSADRRKKPTRAALARTVATDKMRRKLETPEAKAQYARRKSIVEPVFGQVKSSVIEFSQFSWRGLQNVKAEWALICAVHNTLKIIRATAAT